jgi:hypothetical protein
MKKSALLVVINYKDTDSELNGCWNDVANMKTYIQTKGYSEANIRVMTDESADPATRPTRVNIIRALVELILTGGNTLFFHYSGHGPQVRDTNGDEADGRDECLVPLDYVTAGMLVDDELRGILCLLRSDQKLFCILDCCHSGTGMDLKYNLYERYGGVGSAGGGTMILRADYKAMPSTEGSCVMLSGCMDSQTSADAFIAKTYQGALTANFLKTVTEQPVLSYAQLVSGVRKNLKEGKYDQIPMLSSGKAMPLTDRFTL